MYVRDEHGNYSRIDRVDGLHAVEIPASSGTWRVRASNWNDERWILNGTWPSEAAAQEAIRELVDGIDPATYGD